jgi:hypothetical protein
MKLKFLSLLAASLFSIIPAAGAQEFSADVIYTAVKAKTPAAATAATADHSSKLYVQKDRMRLETRGFAGTVLLIDNSEHIALALYPGKRAYQTVGFAPSEFFSVQDPENACADWSKASRQKIACEKVGPDTVDGRKAVKYKNKEANANSASTVWIDSALKFVIKWEAPTTTAELHNIQEGPQSADLFEVPAQFSVLQPHKAASKGFTKR